MYCGFPCVATSCGVRSITLGRDRVCKFFNFSSMARVSINVNTSTPTPYRQPHWPAPLPEAALTIPTNNAGPRASGSSDDAPSGMTR